MSDAGLIEAVAMAIYGAFIREPDPRRIETRWQRMAEATRESFRNEARAAEQVCRAYYRR